MGAPRSPPDSEPLLPEADSPKVAEAYIACCLAGLGMIQIPAYDVKQHLEAGELVEVMPGHRAELMPMTLLYPHRQHLSHRLQVFADWLETLLKDKLL
ncbi:LysR substrate-binding domain-containing protein [Brevundimonas vesicularis]|uniref:LysR substrate-binding domain-containing protein n=1 Tax=Brevundimonas vesicularis TaxID=41276 RepID=UPI00083756AE|nr:LysR substrate-binding domain-containing protein [Brevundimonas vesicularis]